MIKRYPGYMISFIVLFGLLVMTYVTNVVVIRNLNKIIDEKEQEFQILLNENKELRTEYESLISKERIISIAINRLGMIFPVEAPNTLEINREKINEVIK